MRGCPIKLNGFFTKENLNVLPLGSYDSLIGIDWLEYHIDKVECYNKVVECVDEKGMPREFRGILQPISTR